MRQIISSIIFENFPEKYKEKNLLFVLQICSARWSEKKENQHVRYHRFVRPICAKFRQQNVSKWVELLWNGGCEIFFGHVIEWLDNINCMCGESVMVIRDKMTFCLSDVSFWSSSVCGCCRRPTVHVVARSPGQLSGHCLLELCVCMVVGIGTRHVRPYHELSHNENNKYTSSWIIDIQCVVAFIPPPVI